MKNIILFTLLLAATVATAQRIDWKKIESLDPDKILQAEQQPAKVLLLGTFHFAYPQADAHKTDSANFIDVLSEKRQQELQQLADVIRKFKPTRIYIESQAQRFHDSLYTAYRAGNYTPGRNEIYQVAYRVAKQEGLEKLYAVDASNFASQYYQRFPLIDSMWNNNAAVDTLRDKEWNKRYKRYYDAGDSVETKLTMLENFLLMAQPSTLRRMHGAYLVGGFNTLTNDGPDILSMWWYSRNLRIFNNILRTKPASSDRIVVLFGNGHMPILKHCFESSPEFEVVELKELVK